MELDDRQLERYARHIVLREVGGSGQAKLLAARVLIVGAGGLGSPLILYLAAAGVGTLGIVDFDSVALSNLQRQIVHRSDDLGAPKTQSAARAVRALNPDVAVELHEKRLTPGNAADLIGRYDLVADGSDNFATRFLVNDACYFTGRLLVSAAVTGFDGQLATFRAGDRGGRHPCYRCVFPNAPPAEATPSCSDSGVLGAAAGVMGSLQAIEVVKEILGIGESLAGHLLIYDALGARFRKLSVRPDPGCPLCGANPTIRRPAAAP